MAKFPEVPEAETELLPLLFSVRRESYTRTYSSPPATANCQGRSWLQWMLFSSIFFPFYTHGKEVNAAITTNN